MGKFIKVVKSDMAQKDHLMQKCKFIKKNISFEYKFGVIR